VSFLSPYGAVLRVPGARRAFASSLVGRLAYGIVLLSLVLTLTAGNRGYGLAGLAAALLGAGIVLASPARARLVDRHGPRLVLPPMAAGFAAAVTALALIRPGSGARDAVIAALAAAAGASAPPLGVVMRALWSTLVGDGDALQAAYGLDGVAEELLYVAGPAAVGVITVTAAPAVGLLASAGLVAAGTALFLASPALRAWPRPETGPPAGPAGDAGSSRAVLAVALVTAAAGLCLSGLGLVIVAFCQARHAPAAVAWVEAAMSAGSAAGGLWYGAVTWRSSARRRLAALVAGLAVVLAPVALSPGFAVLAVLVAVAGTLVSPALATAYVLANGLAPPGARSRAGNWVSSGYNAGSSAGSVLAGQLVGRVPLGACLPVLAAPALLAVVPLLRGSSAAAAGRDGGGEGDQVR